jgi:hypothetical protein
MGEVPLYSQDRFDSAILFCVQNLGLRVEG